MPNTRFAARAKMIGKFKSGTNCSFNITPCQQMAIAIAKPFVKSFRTVMEDMYKEPITRPDLRKIVITITLP